jgi:hypothetical protein
MDEAVEDARPAGRPVAPRSLACLSDCKSRLCQGSTPTLASSGAPTSAAHTGSAISLPKSARPSSGTGGSAEPAAGGWMATWTRPFQYCAVNAIQRALRAGG